MAQKNLATVVRLHGYLVKNPTNLAAAFPHGGTALGMIVEGAFYPGERGVSVKAEEFNGMPVEKILVDDGSRIECKLRGFDADAISTTWPTTANSGSTIRGRATGTTRAGLKLSTKGFVLLFSPYAVSDHKHILFYRAIPSIGEQAEMTISARAELVTSVVFDAIPDATGRVFDIGLRANLTL